MKIMKKAKINIKKSGNYEKLQEITKKIGGHKIYHNYEIYEII